MKDIDIVVTYLNSSEKEWNIVYKYYEAREKRLGVQESSNRQAFGIERSRDWDTFRYFLRGVEKNLEWIRNIIVVVYNEEQIPEWLNTDNERIRVVCHREYMDEDILPQFNGLAAKFYVSNIEGLSDRYIISDDDFYFINKVPKEMFFRDDKTVQIDSKLPYEMFNDRYLNASDGVFYAMLNNNFELEKRYYPENKKKYWISHMPEARDKLMEQEIIKENYELFKEPFKRSRFRHKDQYTTDLFTDILRIKSDCYMSDWFKKECKYVTLKSTVNFNDYKDYKIVCFNDTEQLDNYEDTKEKLIEFLESKLPNKCSFEK